MIDEDVEVFLEHFGIKGMKWGIRKARADKAQRIADQVRESAKIRPNRINLNAAKKAQAKADRLKRTAEGTRTLEDKQRTARMVKGTIFAGILLASFAPTMKMNDIPKTRSQSVADIINSERNTQASSLKRMFDEGHLNQEQYSRFSETLQNRYDRKLSEATK